MVVKIDRYNRERAFRGFSKLRSSAWQCQGACILRSRELLRCRCEKGLGRGHALVAGVKSLHLGVLCSMVCQVLHRLNGRLPRPVNRWQSLNDVIHEFSFRNSYQRRMRLCEGSTLRIRYTWTSCDLLRPWPGSDWKRRPRRIARQRSNTMVCETDWAGRLFKMERYLQFWNPEPTLPSWNTLSLVIQDKIIYVK